MKLYWRRGRAISVLESLRQSLRAVIFGTPIVGHLVRAQRARAVESSYRKRCALHHGWPAPPRTQELLRERGGPRLAALPHRPRALYVGTDPLQDYSGLLAGLGAVADVVPFTQADGRYGQLDAEGQLSFGLCRPNSRRLLELLAAAEVAGTPFHLVIGQMWAGYIEPASLVEARSRFGVIAVNIAMDDRHAYSTRKLGRRIGTRGLASAIDLAATAAPEAVGWYENEGCPAVFFPEASDPERFRPLSEVEKVHDVCFVGWRYGLRERLVDRLRRAGVDVHTRGAGWPEGRVPLEGMPLLFARSRVVLGVGTVGQSERLLALKLRDFDGPMSGSCYLTQRNPDLAPLYRIGEEIVVYDGVEDCVRLVMELLRDDARRDQIARAGRKRAERDHTWERRFQSLLGILRSTKSAAAPLLTDVA